MATIYIDEHIQLGTLRVRTVQINYVSTRNFFPWFIFDVNIPFESSNTYSLHTNTFDCGVFDFTKNGLNITAGGNDKNLAFGFIDTNTPYKFSHTYEDNVDSFVCQIWAKPDSQYSDYYIGRSQFNEVLGTGEHEYSQCVMFYGISVHFTNDVYGPCGCYSVVQNLKLPQVTPTATVKGLSSFEPNTISIYRQGVETYLDRIGITIATDLIGDTIPFLGDDPDDPNGGGGDSTGNGGGGDGNIGGDSNSDDGLPSISALDSGLLTAYNPTVGELQNLGRFLWSDSFDVNTFKKLFNDPFDTILGLSVVPIKPNTSGTKNIMFGNMDSGVSAAVVSNQWVSKDMGSVTLKEVWKGALDYAPSTGVTIYLPFIGMRQLNVNDVMGSTLRLIYKFDVLTGACIAQIYVNHNCQGNKNKGFAWNEDQGLVYEFIGQCAENIPLASQDFTNTIRAAIGGVSVATGAAASVATGNPALGLATLTVGMANSGMQAATPTVERGGHLSGSAAIMGYNQPFLIVERPHQCKPSRYYELRGVPSQVYTSKLSSCTGFTQITANNNIHCSGAQDSELQEIQNLLVSGVYFPNTKR